MATRAQRRAVRRLHAAMEAFEAQLQCPICLCAYATPASLPCNHCFCEECIHRALELKQVCPICKAPAKKRSLRHDTMIQQLQQAAELWASVVSTVDEKEEEEEKEDERMPDPSGTTPARIHPSSRPPPPPSPSSSATAEPVLSASTPVQIKSRRRKREAAVANGHADSSSDDVPMESSSNGSSQSTPPVGRQKHASESSGEETHAPESKEPTSERVEEEVRPSPFKRRVLDGANGHGHTTTQQAPPPNGHATPQHRLQPEAGEEGAAVSFGVGDLVEVIDRTWRGINKPGGAAWITKVNGNGTYDVKYIIGNSRESNVPDQYILTAREEIVSLATPSRAVKQNRRKPKKLATPPSVDLLGGNGLASLAVAKSRPSDLVFLFSGYTDEELGKIQLWADAMGAVVVENWSNFVTHLIAKCATPKEVAASLAEDDHYAGASSSSGAQSRKRSLFKDEKNKRWVKIRSMKYLKALVAGRWIVSEEWLRDSVKQGKRLAEASYEADGHMKAQNVVAACQRSRTMREEHLRTSSDEVNPQTVGTRLFTDFCFHIYGEFLSPMPPPAELSTLITIGGGKIIHFLDDIALEMDKPENSDRTLVIVSDKLNQQMLRRAAKELTALPQLQGVVNKQVVSYQWILNSISEAKARAFN